MKPVKKVVGHAVPIDRSDIDTDQVIPALWMQRTERTGFEDACFQEWRKSPDFVLNQPAYRDASILVAGHNFGCGSSREHAVWALRDYGFRAIVSPSFADIFRGNALNNGLVTAELADQATQRLMKIVLDDPSTQVEIDVDTRRIIAGPTFDEPFALGDIARNRLLEGLDEIAATLSFVNDIDEYEAKRAPWMPALR